MRQTQQPTQSEMGLLSVAGMLGEISDNTKNDNKLFKSIETGLKKFEKTFEESFSSVFESDWIVNMNKFFTSKDKDDSHKVLNKISDTLTEIFEFFSGAKSKNKPDKKDGKVSLSDLKDKVSEAKNEIKGSINYKSLSDLIETMVKNLNKKLYKKMHDFSDNLHDLLEFDDSKVEKFNSGITKLGEIFEKLEKHLSPVSKSMKAFSLSFILLGFAVLNPLLPLAILMIGSFLNVIAKAMDKKSLTKDLYEFSKGIGLLTLAMFAMTFVPFLGLFKMLGFIYLLGFALRSHRGNNVSKDMIQFGFGIGILTLAMFAMTEIPFESIFKMILFIFTLGAAIKAFSGVTGPPPLVKFAFGLGILVLAMYAMNELPWESIFKTLLFIAGLGLTLKLFGGGNIVGGLPTFAFGLGLMVLAMYAMDELPIEAMVRTLLFITGLGLALKLFNPGSGLNMLMIGGGIIAISAGLYIFKKTGFTKEDAILLGATIVGLIAIMAIVGIPAVAALIVIGSIALAAMGIAVGLLSVSLLIISKININPLSILSFMGAVTILTLGFALLAIPAIPGAIGAALFIPIGISALLAAGTLALISAITVDSTKISTFMSAISTLTWGFAGIAISAIPGAVGAALFLPIAAAGLLGALALLAISKIVINPKNITNFSTGMSLLIDSFNSIGLLQAAKAALKAAAMLPIINSARLAANLFQRIQNIDIQKGKIGLLTMVDTLGLVMIKLESWKNDNATTSIKNISFFVNSFKGLDSANFKSITDTMSKFVDSLSDDKKWDSINKHMNVLGNNMKNIVTNINMLNLQKAIALEKNLKLMVGKDNNTNMKLLIEKLREMIGLLYENERYRQTQGMSQGPTQGPTVPGIDPKFSLIQNKKLPEQQLFDKNDNGNLEPFTNFLDALEAATLNVRIVNDGGTNKVDWRTGY